MAGAEEISVSAIFLYAIKAPPPAPQSPTPDPSPVGRGVNTVVSCALLPNRSVTRNSALRLIAERIRRRLWRPRRSLSYKLQQTWCCGGQRPPIYSSSGGYSKNAITSATYHSPPYGGGAGGGAFIVFLLHVLHLFGQHGHCTVLGANVSADVYGALVSLGYAHTSEY